MAVNAPPPRLNGVLYSIKAGPLRFEIDSTLLYLPPALKARTVPNIVTGNHGEESYEL